MIIKRSITHLNATYNEIRESEFNSIEFEDNNVKFNLNGQLIAYVTRNGLLFSLLEDEANKELKNFISAINDIKSIEPTKGKIRSVAIDTTRSSQPQWVHERASRGEKTFCLIISGWNSKNLRLHRYEDERDPNDEIDWDKLEGKWDDDSQSWVEWRDGKWTND